MKAERSGFLDDIEAGYEKLAADPEYQRECEQRRRLRPQVLLERIANLEAYVQKLEDMIYCEDLREKPAPLPFPVPYQQFPYQPNISPYPYTIINHTPGLF